MRIDDDHLYHGAALIQIAEDPHFTAINSMKLASGISRNAYRINADLGVYLKYASKPTPSHGEYVFTFLRTHLDELAAIAEVTARSFVALVCVRDREICCLPYPDLKGLIERRRSAKGVSEDQYSVLVTAPPRSKFRV